MINPVFSDADRYYYVAINDKLGASLQLKEMSDLQNQGLSDALVLQITIAKLLADEGRNNTQAHVQRLQLAQSMLVELTGSPVGQMGF